MPKYAIIIYLLLFDCQANQGGSKNYVPYRKLHDSDDDGRAADVRLQPAGRD